MRSAIPSASGFILPLAAFELWKLIAMGPQTYIDRTRTASGFIFEWGVDQPGSMDLLQTLLSRITALHGDFKLGLPVAIPLLILAWFAVRADQPLRRLFVVFTSVFLAYAVSWIFLSNG